MKVTLSVTLWGQLEAGPPVSKQQTILEGAVQFQTGVTNSARAGAVGDTRALEDVTEDVLFKLDLHG